MVVARCVNGGAAAQGISASRTGGNSGHLHYQHRALNCPTPPRRAGESPWRTPSGSGASCWAATRRFSRAPSKLDSKRSCQMNTLGWRGATRIIDATRTRDRRMCGQSEAVAIALNLTWVRCDTPHSHRPHRAAAVDTVWGRFRCPRETFRPPT